MKWVLIGVGAIILLVGLAVAWGAVLPRTHVASSAITLRQPPDSVWAVIRDLGSVPSWWRDVKQSVRLPDEGGKERWEQQTGTGPMALEVVESVAPSRMVTRIVTRPGAADYGGTWTYGIVSTAGGEPGDHHGRRLGGQPDSPVHIVPGVRCVRHDGRLSDRARRPVR